MTPEEKRAEEAKRERHWDALRRWQALQETITWAAAQPSVQRNTRAAYLRKQARFLASFSAND